MQAGAFSKWTRERSLTVSLTVAMAVYSYWLASNRTWNPNYAQIPDGFSGTFFRNQAVSMLHGHLWVPEFKFANECFYVDGKCLGYFGIFPSLVRLPFFLLLRSTDHTLAPVSIALAAGVGLWSCLDMLRHVLDSRLARTITGAHRLTVIVLGAFLMGSGGSLVTLSQAKVYREAAIWMTALMLLAFAMALRWLRHGTDRYLVITLLAAIGAVNSRPSAVPAMILLGIWLYFRQHVRGKEFTIRLDSLSFAIIAVPAVSALLVMYLKFRQFTPPMKAWADYQGPGPTTIRRLNGGQLQGIRFAPTNLVQYLRPDSVKYSLKQPWAEVLVPDRKPAILLPPIVNGGILTEPTSSVTNTMPLQLLLTVAASVLALWRTRLSKFIDKHQALPLLVVSATAIPLALVFYSTTMRYVGDFFPFLAVGTVYGGVAVLSWLNERGHLRTALACAMPVAIYFSLVQYSLNVGGWAPVG